jgi:Raf kinase inhibitor-like YbhB/YbcL family protein
MSMQLSSPAFSGYGQIPESYTCDGTDRSPPLNWSDIPERAKSLVLVVDDPDAPDPAAPKMTWVHWVLYNLPAASSGLPEAVDSAHLPRGTLEGLNDWGRTGYGGPCPPIGTHRYFHKLYALDTLLPDLHEPTKAQLENAMRGHVIEQSELIGTYRRDR